MKKIIFYKSLDDEFVKAHYKPKIINKNYKYVSKNIFYKFFSFILYRLIITPIAFIYSKLLKRIKFVNKKVLKNFKKQSYFIFSNHVLPISDALTPTAINFPKGVYIIISSKNMSIPFIGKIIKMIGGLPLPDDFDSSKNFLNAIEKRIKQKKVFVIYPEAQVWPYYTKIRPFKNTSFKYPIKFNLPVFSFTTTFQKTKQGRLKTIIYIDGPFFKNNDIEKNLQSEELCSQVYKCMQEHSKKSNYEKIKYIKKEK